MPGVVVDRYLLYLGLDALKRELRAHAVGIGEVLVRAGLKHIGAAAGFGHGTNVRTYVLLLLWDHDLEFGQHVVEGIARGGILRRAGIAAFRLGKCVRVGFFLVGLGGSDQRRVGP